MEPRRGPAESRALAAKPATGRRWAFSLLLAACCAACASCAHSGAGLQAGEEQSSTTKHVSEEELASTTEHFSEEEEASATDHISGEGQDSAIGHFSEEEEASATDHVSGEGQASATGHVSEEEEASATDHVSGEGQASTTGKTSEQTQEAAQDVLRDGTYEPAAFTAEGGSGKATITCPEVSVEQGAARATLVFSSPHYEWIRADGRQYDPENAGEEGRKTSVFRIPVRLDEKMTVSGLTTAMSEPHEIEYTIFISLAPQEAQETSAEEEGSEEEEAFSAGRSAGEEGQPPTLPGLVFVSAMETAYAEEFDIYTYRRGDAESEADAEGTMAAEGAPETEDAEAAGGAAETERAMDAEASAAALYRLIDVHGSGQYMLVPETEMEISDGEELQALEERGITILRAPLDHLYVAATSSMALFDAAGAIGQVKLTGTKADGWYIDAPRQALADGSMVYAGKYSAPDYELLVSSGCDLAVESMMILHAPEVMEKLEELGIPVFIDTSSNERHPLGRTEWVRLYGVLTGREAEAEAFFEEQKESFAEAAAYEDTGLTVAFFSISANGTVIVRASDDYIPQMIGLAGGTYIFEELANETGSGASVRLSMEDFYNTAKDADFLIYNATIENPVGSIGELCGRSSLLADFKAVQTGSVWQVRKNLYQSPDIAAQMIGDIHGMLTGGGESSEMVFLEKLE